MKSILYTRNDNYDINFIINNDINFIIYCMLPTYNFEILLLNIYMQA